MRKCSRQIWARGSSAVSSVQKEFMEHQGCFEHKFVAQSALDTALKENKEIVVAWLDLDNAFGSLSHQHIHIIPALFGLTGINPALWHYYFSSAISNLLIYFC